MIIILAALDKIRWSSAAGDRQHLQSLIISVVLLKNENNLNFFENRDINIRNT
jgi:hypothetical protein